MIGWEQFIGMGMATYKTAEFDVLCDVYRLVNYIRYSGAEWARTELEWQVGGFFAARAEAAIDGVFRERPASLGEVIAEVRDLAAYCNREFGQGRGSAAAYIDSDMGFVLGRERRRTSFKGSAGSGEYAT